MAQDEHLADHRQQTTDHLKELSGRSLYQDVTRDDDETRNEKRE